MAFFFAMTFRTEFTGVYSAGDATAVRHESDSRTLAADSVSTTSTIVGDIRASQRVGEKANLEVIQPLMTKLNEGGAYHINCVCEQLSPA